MKNWKVERNVNQFELEPRLNDLASYGFEIYSISSYNDMGILYYTIVAYNEG